MVPRVLGMVPRVLGMVPRVLGMVPGVLGVVPGVLGVLPGVLGVWCREVGGSRAWSLPYRLHPPTPRAVLKVPGTLGAGGGGGCRAPGWG